ncbi:Gfo/Idh/MocA family oxidoreductase [Natronolimnobius sp. AArcel1]|uniref:Gfo/Idh/MocA family protein n=1 Tax=Natronolimnobius sp. AArcel1 TaxID=1679093 RepID=UPI0013EDF9FD|nr:Gfo/Idh/MocA family oxidoreductase [Natronolimnobius sp. AArcel1]NGM70632.1 Gfo/Idh/MocA family oxidoreductase [Natronolimnobius sp. AArcel1]
MIDIGILGLDTSHPGKFTEIFASDERTAVTAVWDGGDVRDTEHCEQFCREYDVTNYERPATMCGEVDAAVVTTVNWNTHRELAAPFLRNGTPVLIDKPIAGCVADVDAIVEAARAGGAPLFGGSAVPFHPQFDVLETLPERRTVYCVGYNDPFYYGCHLVDSVRRIVDSNWLEIEPNDAPGTSVDVTFADGSYASLQFDGPDVDGTFAFLTTDEHHTHSITIESDADELDRMYRSYLDAFVDCIETGRDDRDQLVDAATLLLGVQAALTTDDVVSPESDALADSVVDSTAFVSQYSPY